MNKESSSELIERYYKGDEKALNILFTRLNKKIFNICLSRVRDVDVANDLVQLTFLKVIKYLSRRTYKDNGKFEGWVATIARTICMDYFRQQKFICNGGGKILKQSENEDIFKIVTKIEDETYNSTVIDEATTLKLKLLINLLSEEQQVVVRGRIYEEKSYKEIAEETGETLNTLLARMRYALRNLRRIIKEKNIELSL